ncbi:hypothetical protein CMO93_02780 [Candidatus Woesearchaeota archaeon]|nr:hypothetical protein [Candidatus Woesearchaeota archaeon]|tara:strand:+ start:503 stop:1348 length:846 start_codon:yes stop_codon:yes gene_type:complete
MPSIITNSLKESFLAISKNKKIFLLIFILQILFFFLILIVSSFYVSKILESTVEIMQYMDALNLDVEKAKFDVLQQKNPLGENPLLISRNYEAMKKNLLFLLFYIFIIFTIINGLIWYFASNILEKNKKLFSLKNILSYLPRFFIVSLILSLSLFIFAYNFLNISFSGFLSTQPANFIPLLIVAIIAIYFIYIVIPLLNKFKIEEFKTLVKKTFRIGTRNFISIIVSYLIIIILIILSLVLISYLVEINLFLLFIGLILMLLIFAWSKIYFVIVVKKLSSL